jgi:C-terminal processing protease CtpA/Prc
MVWIVVAQAVVAQDLGIPTLTAKPTFLTLQRACELIEAHYVNPQLENSKVEQSAIIGLIKGLQDPDTRYLSPSQALQLRAKQGLASSNRSKKETPSVTQEMMFGTVGYLKLSSFESVNTTQRVLESIGRLKSQFMKSLILDLRNNRGGMLDQAIGVLGAFMDHADVAYTMYRDGYKHPLNVHGTAVYNGPLLVLINRNTASSSEIVAAAIQELKRGIVLGEKSFGKASVQQVFDLPDGSALVMTVAHYVTPKGVNLSKTGVTPDVTLDSNPKLPGDPVLQQAIQEAMVEGYRKK